MTCQECTHFNTSENYPRGQGWCMVEFPSWLYEAAKLNRYEVDTKVSAMDHCSFFKKTS